MARQLIGDPPQSATATQSSEFHRTASLTLL